LNAWVTQAGRTGPELTREYNRSGVYNDLATSVRIVNWAYTQAFECQRLTWVQRDRLGPLSPGWQQSLIGLLN
jgi:hypothetical protein